MRTRHFSTTRHSSGQATRGHWLYFFIVALVVASCGSDNDAASNADVTPAASSQDESDSLNPTETAAVDEPQTGSTSPAADDLVPGCDTSNVGPDLWPDLESVAEENVVSFVRGRTSHLGAANPTTCQAMIPVDPLLSADDAGALAAASTEHKDPYVRYDVFVYGSRTEANAGRGVIRTELAEVLPEGSVTQVSVIGAFIVVGRTWLDPTGVANTPDDIDSILDYYNQLLAGFE